MIAIAQVTIAQVTIAQVTIAQVTIAQVRTTFLYIFYFKEIFLLRFSNYFLLFYI